MRILVIEDDSNKAGHIVTCLTAWQSTSEVAVRHSFQSGLKAAILQQFDLIVLDMTMPSYDVGPREPGGRDRRYAGREILRQLARRGSAVPVVVITQYEQFEENGESVPLSELVASLESEFAKTFQGAIFYQAGNSAWMEELKVLLVRLENSRGDR